MVTKCSDSIMMLRFGKIKVTKEEFFLAKKVIKTCNVDVDNVFVLKSKRGIIMSSN